MFYLSSRGSAASGWIANALNKHPKIVCFQVSRAFPPIKPGLTYPIHDWVKEISVEKYIESLKISEESCRNEKIFGSIHGYMGISAKNICEKYNGFFGYIVRNPLERIHSCWIYNLYKDYYAVCKSEIKNKDVYQHTINILGDKIDAKKYFIENEYESEFKKNIKNIIKNKFPSAVNLYKDFLIQKKIKKNQTRLNNLKYNKHDEKQFVIKEFARVCNDFFKFDQELFNNCKKDSGFKMEELINNKSYFKEYFLPNIVKNYQTGENYYDEVYNLRSFKIGIHREKKIEQNEIWKTLPKVLKEIYTHHFYKYSIDKICNHFDYKKSV